MGNFIKDANWRYATKKFDSDKKLSVNNLDILKEAIRLSVSSYGLQPYQVLIIEHREIKAQLQSASWGQSQVADASHLIVFATETNFGSEHIDKYIKNLAAIRGITEESIKGYADFMKRKINEFTPAEKDNWAAKQAYLALGNLLNAAAQLKIDVTPIEGFEPEKYNKILELEKRNLHAVLIAPIGYRHADDIAQNYAKVRKSNEELFINL